VRLRPAGPAEADAVAEVHAASAAVAFAHIFGGAPYPMERTRQRYRSFAGRVVVAEESGRVVGFVAVDGGELSALYVLPELWGRGVGHRLLEAAGPVRVLWVLEANERGRSFYERHGWRPDGAVQTVAGVRELRYARAQTGAMNATEILEQTRDTLTVRRVYGEPIERDGMLVVPVATVAAGAGAGTGEGRPGPDGVPPGTGGGGGWGGTARPVGVYVIGGGRVEWQPAVDVNRVILGSQVVAIVALLVLRSIVRARRKR
jgi:uncharacterized spore protein YtfJ/GNAT superfamily N-acetyltransferase